MRHAAQLMLLEANEVAECFVVAVVVILTVIAVQGASVKVEK